MEFPGFPCNDFDFHFAEAGAAMAGLVVRDTNGVPRAGVFASTATLVRAGTGRELLVAPFVACRTVGKAVLLGGATDTVSVPVAAAPSANARLDVVYSLPAEVGSGDPVEAVRVATGVAGAVPVKPSIPVGAIELATFRSQAGQTSAAKGTITNTFVTTVTAGGVIPFRTVNEMNAWNGRDGQLGVVGDTLYIVTGNAWKKVREKTGFVTVSTGSLTSLAPSIWGATREFTVPVRLEADERLLFTATRVGNGYGAVQQLSATPNASSVRCALRFTQIGSQTAQDLEIAWRVVAA